MATPDEPVGRQRIVVGVDGSDTSRRALRWAADEAGLRDAELHVVHAWEVTPPGVGIGLAGGTLSPAPDARHTEADHLVTQVVEEELGGEAPAHLRRSIGRGTATDVLLDAAKGADLLVVGSRGLGGFAGLLLGSVSMKMAHHVSCPLVIVRPPAADQS